MPTNPTILVIVPCYNEENRLSKKPYQEFVNREPDYKFLFVDDGSTDGTFKLLNSLRQERPDRFDVLKLERNSGKAEAVRQGFLKGMDSGVNFLAFWDADLATPLHILPSFLTVLKGRPTVEMVLGSRIKLMGADIKRHEYRHYLGRIFATAASFVLKLSIYDTQCGAKMFRATDNLRKIFQDPFHSKWIFDVELIARFSKLKTTVNPSIDVQSFIYELPLPIWHDIKGSKLQPLDFFKAFFELLQIYRIYHFKTEKGQL